VTFQKARIARYVDTVWGIAASPYVASYMIGLTARSGWDRRKEYHAYGYDHLVILADRLTKTEAQFLEKALQNAIRNDRRHTNYRKYDPDRRDKRYYPSVGQPTASPTRKIYSVYMAWWEGE